jgi:RNA polymerase sigma-70 factor (ECF subfamily)
MASDDKVLSAFLRHRDQLESLIYRRVRCRATAADLVQDLFVRMAGRAAQPAGGVLGYLLRSARNLAVDHLRAEQRHARLLAEGMPEQSVARPPLPDADIVGRQETSAVVEALRRLPARPRQAFLLHKVHGRPYAEIASAFGVSLSTIEKDMHRALAACKAALAEPPPE